MKPEDIIVIVSDLVRLSKSIYDIYTQITGGKDIPTWDEIIANNVKLQEKIDAEK